MKTKKKFEAIQVFAKEPLSRQIWHLLLRITGPAQLSTTTTQKLVLGAMPACLCCIISYVGQRVTRPGTQVLMRISGGHKTKGIIDSGGRRIDPSLAGPLLVIGNLKTLLSYELSNKKVTHDSVGLFLGAKAESSSLAVDALRKKSLASREWIE